jgi:hypothetical protein
MDLDLLADDDDDDIESNQIWWKGFPHDILGHIINNIVYVDWITICKWIGIRPKPQHHQMLKPSILIDHTTGKYKTQSHDQPRAMIPLHSLVNQIKSCINRQRKHLEYKKEMLSKIGLGNVIQPALDIEHQCLGPLIHSCPFTILCNYRLGKYKIDAYIPDLRLAIEIDEHNHKGYNPNQEKTREREIRNSSMVLLRFNPHQHKYPAQVLVMEVWKKTLSPEMKAFVRLL